MSSTTSEDSSGSSGSSGSSSSCLDPTLPHLDPRDPPFRPSPFYTHTVDAGTYFRPGKHTARVLAKTTCNILDLLAYTISQIHQQMLLPDHLINKDNDLYCLFQTLNDDFRHLQLTSAGLRERVRIEGTEEENTKWRAVLVNVERMGQLVRTARLLAGGLEKRGRLGLWVGRPIAMKVLTPKEFHMGPGEGGIISGGWMKI